MLKGNSGNNGGQFEFLDILAMVGFCAQLDNMSKNGRYTNFISNFLDTISNEIELLHKENEIIIQQNEEILNLLKREKYMED